MQKVAFALSIAFLVLATAEFAFRCATSRESRPHAQTTTEVQAGTTVRATVTGTETAPDVVFGPEGATDDTTAYSRAGRAVTAEAAIDKDGTWVLSWASDADVSVELLTMWPADKALHALSFDGTRVSFTTTERDEKGTREWQLVARPYEREADEGDRIACAGTAADGVPVEAVVDTQRLLRLHPSWRLYLSIKTGEDVETYVAGDVP